MSSAEIKKQIIQLDISGDANDGDPATLPEHYPAPPRLTKQLTPLQKPRPIRRFSTSSQAPRSPYPQPPRQPKPLQNRLITWSLGRGEQERQAYIRN